MRKFSLYCLATCFISIILFSCKKDNGSPDPDDPLVSSEDPAKLSQSIRVWHGTRTPGNLPQSNSTLPTLDPAASPTVEAFAGRYAIIKPEILDGEVEGYYVGIAGSGEYFKVDFTTPRDIAGRIQRKNPLTGRLFNPQDGVADSSIVIVLPSNLQVPDTFCVTYFAYDAYGNIGAPVTTCIYINELGSGVESAWLHNEWRITASWINNDPHDTLLYNVWLEHYFENGYGCYVDPVTGQTLLTSQASGPFIVEDSMRYLKKDLRLATNGACELIGITQYRKVDESSSTCSDIQFTFNDDIRTPTGAWGFNQATGRFLIIYELDAGIPELIVEEYNLIKISNTNFVLDGIFMDDHFFFRFERL